MEVFHHKQELSKKLASVKDDGVQVGFVPTMGALHKGHLSLVEMAINSCSIVVVSIFVNPTQFNNPNDLKSYPRTLDKDVLLLKSLGNHKVIVYAPSVKDIYGDYLRTETFRYGSLETVMEGAYREGHFNGVGTIVRRLFQIVKPHKAFFGEKDYQQLLIIKRLVEILKLPIEIVGGPIFRENDGLAMSSRNSRLTTLHRFHAPFIYKTLKAAKEKFGTESANIVVEWVEGQFKQHECLKLEYFLIADSETLKPVKRKSRRKNYRAFIAVYAGDVRLIDNIPLN